MTGLLPARRMRSNIRWNLMGNLAYALGQFVQLIILARMGGPAAVGTYVLALSLTAPVMMTSLPCCQSAGVATLCLAVSCIESITRKISWKLRPVVMG